MKFCGMYFLSGTSTFLGCTEAKIRFFKTNQFRILWFYELNMF